MHSLLKPVVSRRISSRRTPFPTPAIEHDLLVRAWLRESVHLAELVGGSTQRVDEARQRDVHRGRDHSLRHLVLLANVDEIGPLVKPKPTTQVRI